MTDLPQTNQMTQNFITKIKELKAQKLGNQKIAEELNGMGLKTIRGKKWTAAQVAYQWGKKGKGGGGGAPASVSKAAAIKAKGQAARQRLGMIARKEKNEDLSAIDAALAPFDRHNLELANIVLNSETLSPLQRRMIAKALLG